MSLTDKQWMLLARDLRKVAGRVAPEWTDSNTHDPGVTVLELLSYAITDLHTRRHAFDERARRVAASVAELAAVLATPQGQGDACPEGLQRVNFMTGMMLGVEDFRAEQAYVRERLDRRNRLLLGSGIAGGLEVTVERDTGAGRLVVSPGLAIDASGHEIVVERPHGQALPPAGAPLFVLLRYVETPCRFVPVSSDPAVTDPAMQATRITETFQVELAAAADDVAVAVAKLRVQRGRWRLDPSFKPARLRG